MKYAPTMEWVNVPHEPNKLELENNVTGTAWIHVTNSKVGVMCYLTRDDKRRLRDALAASEDLELEV